MTTHVRQEAWTSLKQRLHDTAEEMREHFPEQADGLWDENQLSQKLLSPRAMRVWRALAEAILDDGEGGPSSAQLDWFVREMNDFQAASAGLPRVVLHLLPLLLESAPWLSASHVLPFSMLSCAQRLRCLERMERHKVSQLGLVVFMAKTLICTIFFEHPDAQRALDFDGRCLVDEQFERRLQREILH